MRLKRYRLLLCFVALALFTAYWEITDVEDDIELRMTPRGFPEVYTGLYPTRADSLYFRAVQAREAGNLAESRRIFEQALGTGVKTDEGLLYQYIVTLVQMRADPGEIESAVANWRRNFPHSSLPEPELPADPQAPSQTQSPPGAKVNDMSCFADPLPPHAGPSISRSA